MRKSEKIGNYISAFQELFPDSGDGNRVVILCQILLIFVVHNHDCSGIMRFREYPMLQAIRATLGRRINV